MLPKKGGNILSYSQFGGFRRGENGRKLSDFERKDCEIESKVRE